MLSSRLASLQELSEAAPELLILKCVCAGLANHRQLFWFQRFSSSLEGDKLCCLRGCVCMSVRYTSR